MLCWFLPHIPMNQPQVYRCPLPLEPPSHLPAHPTPLGCHRAPSLGSLSRTANSHWLTIFHIEMCMFPCYSVSSLHPLLPLTVSTSLFPRTAFPLLPCKKVHQYHLLDSIRVVLFTQSCLTLCTPWTVAHQAPLSMGFTRQEYWRDLPFPSLEGLPDAEIEARSLALQTDS